MNPFTTFERLGDIAEITYRTIYTGGEIEFEKCVLRFIHIFENLADAGMIENITKKKIEEFLTRDVSLSDMQVISRYTNDVVLVNTKIHELDAFDLRQFITWITEELCKDPIMKKRLCGRNNYEGVKRILNSYADKECQSLEKENWIDYYVCKDKVFYTKKGEKGIHLYALEKCEANSLFSRKRNKHKDIQLIKEKLLDGRVYHFTDGTVFVETACGYIVKISSEGSGNCCYSRIEGSIIKQLDDGSLLFINNDKIVQLKSDGRKKMLVDNLKMEKTGGFNNLTGGRITYCLNNGRVSKEMLWKGLLFTLYDFDCMNFDNKIGNRLRFAEFFDMLPVPFSLNEILNKLSEIERYCYEGDVNKADGYIEAMGYLISLEDEPLDEKRTMNALTYLLDNVTSNPYGRIVDSSGWGIINCVDFFFGDTEEEDEVHFEGEDELKIILDNIAENMSAEQFNREIDKLIAELEGKID